MSFDRQIFDPEHENITCPKCYSRRVYSDRQKGRYCMFCGHVLSTEEVEALLEHQFRQMHAALGGQRQIVDSTPAKHL